MSYWGFPKKEISVHPYRRVALGRQIRIGNIQRYVYCFLHCGLFVCVCVCVCVCSTVSITSCGPGGALGTRTTAGWHR